MKSIKQIGYQLLTNTKLGKRLVQKTVNTTFPGSASYWEKRYRNNGNSGRGSYGANAIYKSQILNRFVLEKNVVSVVELGCGDGNQLKQLHFKKYTGLDVSPTAIKKCKEIFSNDFSKKFYLYTGTLNKENTNLAGADLVLSLDVIYHLVEDKVYENYMHDLFSMSAKYVIIYAWDLEEEKKFHVRHRNFSKWIQNNIHDFQFSEKIDGKGTFCDFFIYNKI